MIHGVDFDHQLITAANMGHFMNTFSGKRSGVTKGITMSYSGNTITIQAGYMLVSGRLTEITGTETVSVAEVSSGTTYCRLVYEVDLSKTNTESSFLQGSFKVLTNNDAYPTLTQQNLDDYTTTGVYQIPLAKFELTSSGIGSWVDERVTVDAGMVRQTTISLPTASWSGSASPYSQVITVSGSTSTTKIDLQPNSTALAQLIEDGTNALYVENNSGTLTAYAVGEKPTANLSIQATLMEVSQ